MPSSHAESFMGYLSIRNVPSQYVQTQYPGLFDIGETMAATMLAEYDTLPAVRPSGETAAALFAKLRQEAHRRYAGVPATQIDARLRVFIENFLFFDRGHLAGPPLRLSWFLLSYHAWVLVLCQVRPGMLDEDAVAQHRAVFIRALHELGVTANHQDVAALIGRFRPRGDAADSIFDSDRAISLASGVVVHYVRFLHFTALRNRVFVRTRFTSARVLIVSPDREIETDTRRYLVSHGVDCATQHTQAVGFDAVVAVLNEQSVSMAAFWSTLAAARSSGLRPLVLLACPRSRLETIEREVAKHHSELYQWLISTAVVELGRDNKTGFLSILRGLEPERRWWWRDDAIPDVMAKDGFSIFETDRQLSGEGGLTDMHYPEVLDTVAIERGVSLAEEYLRETDGHEAFILAVAQWSERRQKFPEGHFRLPWLVLTYQFRLYLAGASLTDGEPSGLEQTLAALQAFGVHAKWGEFEPFVRELSNLGGVGGSGDEADLRHNMIVFIHAILGLNEIALATNTKSFLKVPLNSVFISYSTENAAEVRELVRGIESHENADVWLDANSISIGRNLTDTLRDGIAAAERYVLYASQEAANSEWVQLEVAAALELDKQMLVIAPDSELCPEWRALIGRWQDEADGITIIDGSAGVDTCAASLVKHLRRRPDEIAGWLESISIDEETLRGALR